MSSINVSETKSLVFENGFLLFMFSNYLVSKEYLLATGGMFVVIN